MSLYALLDSFILVFLVLSALYERWTLPIAILLAVPFSVFGAFLAVWIANGTADIYFQIGIVALIGLAAKNAILIVEFAKEKRKEGKDITESALEASKLRFRAIMMTSLTMIVGALPLILHGWCRSSFSKIFGYRHHWRYGNVSGRVLRPYFL